MADDILTGKSIGDVIAFAEAYKGDGWRVTSVESFRYKDTGERLWSVRMQNARRGTGEASDRLLIDKENSVFRTRSVELNRVLAPNHYRHTDTDDSASQAV